VGRAVLEIEEVLVSECVPSMYGESNPIARCGECRLYQSTGYEIFDRFFRRLYLPRWDMGDECERNHGQDFRRGGMMSRCGSGRRARPRGLANRAVVLPGHRRRRVGHGRQMRPRRNGTREIQRVLC
jgi:hypothetical protein